MDRERIHPPQYLAGCSSVVIMLFKCGIYFILQVIILHVSPGRSQYRFQKTPRYDRRFSTQLFHVIEFYKQPDPVGLPMASIPDPLSIPPFRQSIAFTAMEMRDLKTYGLSRLRIRLFEAKLSSMVLRLEVSMDELLVNGSYAINMGSSGPFWLKMKNVRTMGNVSLGVDREGILRTRDIELDFGFEDMAMDFQNLGWFGRVFQGLANAAPNMVFDMVKPYMLKEVHVKLQNEIDSQIEQQVDKRAIVLANSVPPLDLMISEARFLMRTKGFDPYHIPDYRNSLSIFNLFLSGTRLRGLSNFYRSGEMEIAVQNKSMACTIQVGTGRIEGSTRWQLSVIRDVLSRSGAIFFSVQYVRLSIKVNQPLDLRKKPSLMDFQLELGNIQIFSSGAGSMDYLVEAGVNIVPNLLRSQVVDAIERPLRVRIREKLECINVEQFVKRHVADFERRGTNMVVDWRLCERKLPEK
ncbi:AAEL009669-PA [Aedes aegypti]|uniref:AAEL009669-PA n=2 Tax=Aedes aegypti TaxID=7159 RepID=A0A1S4FN58_AEDAE|nr:uncharacterized protein LOC5572233 [Aedes aegypti]EAT38428.1 AAEL009669-PA [Aedes aegypti]